MTRNHHSLHNNKLVNVISRVLSPEWHPSCPIGQPETQDESQTLNKDKPSDVLYMSSKHTNQTSNRDAITALLVLSQCLTRNAIDQAVWLVVLQLTHVHQRPTWTQLVAQQEMRIDTSWVNAYTSTHSVKVNCHNTQCVDCTTICWHRFSTNVVPCAPCDPLWSEISPCTLDHRFTVKGQHPGRLVEHHWQNQHRDKKRQARCLLGSVCAPLWVATMPMHSLQPLCLAITRYLTRKQHIIISMSVMPSWPRDNWEIWSWSHTQWCVRGARLRANGHLRHSAGEGGGVPLVFWSKCFIQHSRLSDTRTTPSCQHGRVVLCCGYAAARRGSGHRKSCDLRCGRCDMSLLCCWFPFLGCFYPVTNGQASSLSRPRCCRRWQAVACVASFQTYYVLTELTNSWCCVSNCCVLFSGSEHGALETGNTVHDDNHVHAGKRICCRSDTRLCCLLIHTWCSEDEPPRKRFCKSPAWSGLRCTWTKMVKWSSPIYQTLHPRADHRIREGRVTVPLAHWVKNRRMPMKWRSVHWWGVGRVVVCARRVFLFNVISHWLQERTNLHVSNR